MKIMTMQTKKIAQYTLYTLLVAGVCYALWLFISPPTIFLPVKPSTVQTDSLLHTTVQTTDRAFLLELTITPKSVGTNTFAARVMEAGTNRVRTDVSVDLYATNSDMDMGTKVIHLQPDGKKSFGARDELTMDGHWQVRMEVHTHQKTLHKANVSFQILT